MELFSLRRFSDRATNGRSRRILGFMGRLTGSSDPGCDPYTLVVRVDRTRVMEGRMVPILSWYDDAWGFPDSMADTAVPVREAP